MEIQQNIVELDSIVSQFLDSKNIELVDLELKGSIGNQILRVFIDIEGGISLDRCVEISREISDILDMKDMISGKYRLDVSSPGLDRPLKTTKDFQRHINRNVKITLQDNAVKEGEILNICDTEIFFKNKQEEFKLPISLIKYAKIKLKW